MLALSRSNFNTTPKKYEKMCTSTMYPKLIEINELVEQVCQQPENNRVHETGNSANLSLTLVFPPTL